MPKATLLQFPISHFCEKTRWNLEWKGVPYRIVNVPPVVNRIVGKRLGVRGTVPILFIDGKTLGDSKDISAYLEERSPARPLVAKSGPLRDQALGLEEWFGANVGPAQIRWMYGTMMQNEGDAARTLFGYQGVPSWMIPQKFAARFEVRMRKALGINEAKVEASKDVILTAMDSIEVRLEGGKREFLVGESLTIADITVASLLGPLIAPPGSPWGRPVPASIEAVREESRARPVGRWVWTIYERYRFRRGAA